VFSMARGRKGLAQVESGGGAGERFVVGGGDLGWDLDSDSDWKIRQAFN